jgi:hypothetical protein
VRPPPVSSSIPQTPSLDLLLPQEAAPAIDVDIVQGHGLAREAQPSAASRTMRARRTMRCSVVDARSQPSRLLRVFLSRCRISVAWESNIARKRQPSPMTGPR